MNTLTVVYDKIVEVELIYELTDDEMDDFLRTNDFSQEEWKEHVSHYPEDAAQMLKDFLPEERHPDETDEYWDGRTESYYYTVY